MTIRHNYKDCQYLCKVEKTGDYYCDFPLFKSRAKSCRTICRYPSLFDGKGIMKRYNVLVEF